MTAGGESAAKPKARAGFAVLVAAGILLSRIAGLIRERVSAHYLGNSLASGAWKAGLKIPNFLQNLFGEGVLSASFIPVYARLIAKDDEELAGRVAGAVFSLLALVISVIVVIGTFLTPWIIELIAPGFEGEARALTIRIVQILFPATGLLVLSAWCLGILNSHHKFFLSYVAPVFWNGAMIATMLFFGSRMSDTRLAVALAWGNVAGSALQFGVQLPFVLRYVPKLRLSLQASLEPVQEVINKFGTVIIGRGVVQLSGYIDQFIASYLKTAAVSALGYAQTIYFLPVSLFAMSVAAAELPAMSRAVAAGEDIESSLRTRVTRGLRQIAFFVIPSVVAFLFIGRTLVAALYQTGKFGDDDTLLVWYILAGSTVGLLAVALGRLYANAFYALSDPKTPLRFAMVRVALTAVLGVVFAFPLRPAIIALLHLLRLPVPMFDEGDLPYGAIGLTASAGMAGWVEFMFLRRALAKRIGEVKLTPSFQIKLWASALAGAAAGLATDHFGRSFLERLPFHHISSAIVICLVFGVVYFGMAMLTGVPEARGVLSRFKR